MKALLFLSLLFGCTVFLPAQSDAVRAAWTTAKNLCNENQYTEAKSTLLAVYQEMPRPLCCFWLGTVYSIESKRDSAIFYFEKAIKNSRKPQLAALDHLIRENLRKLDFEKAYQLAWQALVDNPGNEVFLEEFKEVCLWSYFIKHMGFNKHYLTQTKLQKEYQSKTITEQALIIKNIRNKEGQYLHVGNRQYKGHHEIWKCRFNNSKEDIDIKFHLHNHKLDHQIELQHQLATKTYNNKEETLMVRLGALMALKPFDDKQALDLLAAPEEEVRSCLCSELTTANGKKVKKACLGDASEVVKAMCNNLALFKQK
jgi:tetratricopeptide (TPR) repeat protein